MFIYSNKLILFESNFILFQFIYLNTKNYLL